jgi:glycosyltransferase involved in cell wall biosynthesis
MIMKRIFFDITDIVEYARGHSQVSGIQRVQARVIAELAKKHGGERIVCTFWNSATKEYNQVPADGVFDDAAFDPRALLSRLGATKEYRLLDKGDVKRFLQKYNNRKIYRGVRKLDLYLSALLCPGRLSRLGFKHAGARPVAKALSLKKIDQIPAGDVLVFLGANWSNADVLDIGRRHRGNGGHVVQMIYDLIPYVQPKYFTSGLIGAYKDFLVGTPDYVSGYLCISDWTKKDLESFLSGVPNYAPSVRSVPLAHEFSGFPRNATNVQPDDHTLLSWAKSKKYVLCVGTVEVRKNGANLLRAWQRILASGRTDVPTLVFAGKYGWKISEFTGLLEGDPLLSAHVKVIAGPSDRDLAFLYEHCLFTMYPSFYEGWGLPVGEAAWFGKFCIGSSATSVPEVCGDLIDYVDPDSVSDIAERIAFALDNPGYVVEKEKRLRESPMRSWSDVSDLILDHVLAGVDAVSDSGQVKSTSMALM